MPRIGFAEALIRKLATHSDLSATDIDAIEALPFTGRSVRPHQRIIAAHDRSTACCLVIHGVVFKSKTMADGQRQILSIHTPGDIPNLHNLYLPVMDHDLMALSDCMLGFIEHPAMRELC